MKLIFLKKLYFVSKDVTTIKIEITNGNIYQIRFIAYLMMSCDERFFIEETDVAKEKVILGKIWF